MQGLGVEAARQLAAATTQLRFLEAEHAARGEKVKSLQEQVKEKKIRLALIRRQREQHVKQHDSLMHGVTTLNERNARLINDIKTKQEAVTNVVAHLDDMAQMHQRLAMDLDQSAMHIQMTSAQLEASGVERQHEENRLRELRDQRSTAEKTIHDRSMELSRLRVHSDKAMRESLYVERVLEDCSSL
jgi:chromosome segregation ATPase